MRGRWLALALAAGLMFAPVVGVSQVTDDQRGPVLVLRQDVLFEQSAFGQASLARLDRESRALAAENRQIEAALEAEELALTEARKELAPDAFRARADAFNEKVEGIRRAQDTKSRAITRTRDEDRQTFLNAVAPMLAEMMQEMGASVILDQQSVVISLDRVDITEAAIARINLRLETGTTNPPPVAPPAQPQAP
jgi:Skp family chaperone for outer membrane proteins